MAIEKRHIGKLNELRQFFLQNGHCYVPSTKEYADLSEWVQNIKLSRLRLSKELTAELDSMGFDWEIYNGYDSIWLGHYYSLVKFKEKYGHLKVSCKTGDYIKLGRWVNGQRIREAKLPSNRKRLLNEIGFLWSRDIKRLQEEKWLKNYNALAEFKAKYGHCRPKIGQLNKDVIKWIDYHRRIKEKTAPKRVEKLEELGFLWREDIKRLEEIEWQDYYRQLIAFKEKNGHCQVTDTTAEKSFYYWVQAQRRQENKLPKEKKLLLDDLGFLWSQDLQDILDNSWNKHYQALKEFYKENGHCKVPAKYVENPSLGAWVIVQRKMRKRLNPKRKQLLDAIDFHWKPLQILQKNWGDRFKKLKKFYKKYGHSKVPQKWQEDKELARWVRYLIENEHLISDEWKVRLKEVDFKWKDDIKQARVDAWMIKYNQLKTFYKKHGHFRVTKADSSLQFADWVSDLRYKKNNQPEWRIKLLNEINFNWESQPLKKKYWNDRYAELLVFYKQHGHINVLSTGSTERLWKWIYHLKNRKSKLSKEQLEQLEMVKFEW